jgi:hypothetical protein
MKKRETSVDFSNHELKVTESERVTIYEFKKPGTIVNGLTFIVGVGVTTVTGDFGNWVFCREFHPKPKDYVSRGYFDEKLRIASEQTCEAFDSEETLKEIENFKYTFYESFDREMTDEEEDWIQSLIDNVYDDFQYKYIAYREMPNSLDFDYAPFGKKRHVWLEIVYDAFNEMCDAMEKVEVIS